MCLLVLLPLLGLLVLAAAVVATIPWSALLGGKAERRTNHQLKGTS